MCARLLRAGKPFACLMPSDLVVWTAVRDDGRTDKEVQARLATCTKLASLSADLVWVVYGMDMPDMVFTAEETAQEERKRTRWVQLQQEESDSYRKFYGPAMATREDGLCVVVSPDHPVRIIVPTRERRSLTFRTHRDLAHQGHRKVFNVLNLSYT